MKFPLLKIRSRQFIELIEEAQFTHGSGESLSPEEGMEEAFRLLGKARDGRRSVYVIGNGGSSAIASHAITDFTNVAGIRAKTLHESSLMTCMANDYGYENGFARILGTHALEGDLLIAISSSGRSKNILNAVGAMKEAGGLVFTLSGFSRDNALRKTGDLNLWLDSHDYGLVEIAHLFILHNLADRFGALKQESLENNAKR
ncbi:MAG: SIS domain-containing protein [Candidatus Omnitrophica bacterium]|nr:SIS domain-containing protein [Candidatus Omnitrophota bacterium]